MRATIDRLVNEIGEDESHPLADLLDLLDLLATQAEARQAGKPRSPRGEPRAVPRLPMEQHGLRRE